MDSALHGDDLPHALDHGVVVTLGVFGEELMGEEGAVRRARDDIGEGAAPVDAKLPRPWFDGKGHISFPARLCEWIWFRVSIRS